MRRCILLVAVLAFARLPAIAQSPSRTPWGDPDLQATWDFTTITPLQRPTELAQKAFLTESEAAALEKQINQQRVQTEEVSPGSLGGVPRPATDPGIYNLSWCGSRMGDAWLARGERRWSSIRPTGAFRR